MLEPQEIRLGNWILNPRGQPFRVDEMDHFGKHHIHSKVGMRVFIGPLINHPVMTNEVHPATWNLSEMQPIPITPEILQKCGFKPIADGHLIFQLVNGRFWFEAWPRHDGRYHIDAAVEEDGGTPPICATDITSLHHFQNVYYFTTGQELEVKL